MATKKATKPSRHWRVTRGGDYIADRATHERVIRETNDPAIGPAKALEGVTFTRIEPGTIVTLPPWAEADYLEIGAIECVDPVNACNEERCAICPLAEVEASDG